MTDFEPLLGVDLGTTHTVAALTGADSRSQPLLFDASFLLSSSVYAEVNGHLLIGNDAQRSAGLDPARFEPNPKRRIDDGRVVPGAALVVYDFGGGVGERPGRAGPAERAATADHHLVRPSANRSDGPDAAHQNNRWCSADCPSRRDRRGRPAARGRRRPTLADAHRQFRQRQRLRHACLQGNPTTTSVAVMVTDDSGPVSDVKLSWSGFAVGDPRAMTKSGDTWTATIGPVPFEHTNNGGTLTITVTATDVAGLSTTIHPRSVAIGPCAFG